MKNSYTLSLFAFVGLSIGANAQCVTEVWGGARHCIALRADSTVWTWGGLIPCGDNTNLERDSPVQVHGFNNVGFMNCITHIMSGEAFNFILKSDGTVWSWGINGGPGFTGTLGDGVTVNEIALTPVQVINLDSVISLGGRGYHALCIRADSSVWGWGCNLGGGSAPGGGQLGIDTSLSHGSAIAIRINGLPHVRQVTGGGFFSMALASDNSVWAWGNNYWGQLGIGSNISISTPTQVPGLTNVKQISGGWFHAVVLKADSTVWTMGLNSSGQLGLGNVIDRNIPVQVPGMSGVIQVSGGDRHTTVLKSDGTVWTCGENIKGECGDGTKIQRNNFVQVTGLTNVNYITARDYQNVVIKADGSLWAWGWNINGQCGHGTNGDTVYVPVQIQVLGCKTVVKVSDVSDNSFSVTIYPNPVSSTFTVKTTGEKIKEIKVVNVDGEIVNSEKPIDNTAVIDMSNATKGIYFVEIKTKKNIINKKIVVTQ